MKLHKNIGLSLAVLAVLAQVSCLKDKPNNASPNAGSNNVVEFQNTAVPKSYTSPFAEYDNGVPIDPTADTGSFRININYTGAETVAPVDITVNLALSQAALDSFNNNVGTSYEIPPSDVFSFPATATIPKGTRQIIIRPIITAAADYDYTKSYALPLMITSSSFGVVSSNYGTAIFQFIAENKYDGAYQFTQETVGWGAYSIADGVSYTWPNNVNFATVGQFQDVTDETGVGEGHLQLAFSPTGSATAFGATGPQFTFDPATDALLSVVNTVPNDGRNRQFALNPAVTDSRYDASTKTIYAAYLMTQNGRPTQYIYDTLVYQGTR
jgi:Domain of unknown function (DUF1735)